MRNTNTHRILLIAPYADPEDVGEAWSTFQWLRGITDNYPQATILGLHKRGKSIKKYFPEHKVVSWQEIHTFSRFERFNAMLKPSYPFFYVKARKWIKSELKKGENWDLIHQISPLALRYPCPAHDIGVPYILGPLAGSITVPRLFEKEMKSARWYTKLSILDKVRFQFDRVLRKTFQNSTLLIGVAPYVKNMLDGIPINDFVTMNETGICAVHEENCQIKERAKDNFRLLYVGRIIRSKGLRDVVRALGILKRSGFEKIVLDVLGGGEDRIFCENEAKQLNIDDQIIFHGRVKKSIVCRFYKEADLFVFPSFKEPSGNVILEAMSYGLPMIVCSQGGPGYTVKESFAIKISAENPVSYANKLARSIGILLNEPQRLKLMRENAINEAKSHHLWPEKIKVMLDYYDKILSGKKS